MGPSGGAVGPRRAGDPARDARPAEGAPRARAPARPARSAAERHGERGRVVRGDDRVALDGRVLQVGEEDLPGLRRAEHVGEDGVAADPLLLFLAGADVGEVVVRLAPFRLGREGAPEALRVGQALDLDVVVEPFSPGGRRPWCGPSRTW